MNKNRFTQVITHQPANRKKLRIAESCIGIIIVIAACIWRITSNVCMTDYKDRYQWAVNLSEGKLPYRDFNMLQTPLSLWYYSVFFRLSRSLYMGIFCATLLVIASAVFAFLICKKINPKAHILPIALWLAAAIAVQGAIYNSMSILLWMAALYVFYCYREKPHIIHLILISILVCCCFFAKQNMGAYCLASMGLCFICHWISAKTPLKTAIAHTGILLLCYAGCWGLWLGIFAVCGNLPDFIEYCLHSSSGFVSFYTSREGFNSDLLALRHDIVCFLVIGFLSRQKELGITGAFMVLLAFPIYNSGHTFPALITFSIMLAVWEPKKLNWKWKRVIQTAGGLFMLYQAGNSAYMFFLLDSGALRQMYETMYITTMDDIHLTDGNFKSAAPYLEQEYDAALLPYLEAHKDNLSQYHIADTIGAWYNIYFDRYDQYYDLFLTGNLGTKTPTDVIKETIAAEPDCFFILWAEGQEDTIFGYYGDDIYEAFSYIRTNCTLTETLYGADGSSPRWEIYQP